MMRLIDRPEEVEKIAGELDLAQVAPSSRIAIETDNWRLMVVVDDTLHPDYRFLKIIEATNAPAGLRNGQIFRVLGPIYDQGSNARAKLVPAFKLVQDQGLGIIRAGRYGIRLSAIRHVWVNGQQIF